MPVLVNKIIFTLVPNYSPWFIRWFVRMIFGQMTQMLVVPELKKHVRLVSACISDFIHIALMLPSLPSLRPPSPSTHCFRLAPSPAVHGTFPRLNPI